MLELRLPRPNEAALVARACDDPWALEWGFAPEWVSCARDLERFVERLRQHARGEGLPAGHVPCTFLFAFSEGGELVGRVSIRHTLNEHLSREGGHVGYGVLPQHRRRGYAREILRLALFRCRDLGLARVLVTCDDENEGSWRVIEANGGALEGRAPRASGGGLYRRYWVELGAR